MIIINMLKKLLTCHVILSLNVIIKASQQHEEQHETIANTNIQHNDNTKCPIDSKYISLIDNTNSNNANDNDINNDKEKEECYIFGCPIYPLDIIFEQDVNEIIKIANEEESKHYSSNVATLTLTGNKGKASLNQDRAFVIPNYRTESSILKKLNDNEICVKDEAIIQRTLSSSDNDDDDDDDTGTTTTTINNSILYPSVLLGVFDGHGHEGEKVSQHSVTQISQLLHTKLNFLNNNNDIDDSNDNIEAHIKESIIDTFHTINSTISTDTMGGSTGSIVLQLGHKVYIANTGDSRSFLALVRITDDNDNNDDNANVEIIYTTVEHKPDVPFERHRIESTYGGKVHIPPPKPNSEKKGTSRVMYKTRMGNTVGLAMSRSIGDWDGANSGVIATPDVDVIDLLELMHNITTMEKENDNIMDDDDKDANKQQCQKKEEQNNDRSTTTTPTATTECSSYTNSKSKNKIQYKLFAVSATDGLLDALPLQTIANALSNSLYYYDNLNKVVTETSATDNTNDNDNDNNDDEKEEEQDSRKTLVGTCYNLIVQAAKVWGNGYRDDIALSVSDIKLPTIL